MLELAGLPATRCCVLLAPSGAAGAERATGHASAGLARFQAIAPTAGCLHTGGGAMTALDGSPLRSWRPSPPSNARGQRSAELSPRTDAHGDHDALRRIRASGIVEGRVIRGAFRVWTRAAAERPGAPRHRAAGR